MWLTCIISFESYKIHINKVWWFPTLFFKGENCELYSLLEVKLQFKYGYVAPESDHITTFLYCLLLFSWAPWMLLSKYLSSSHLQNQTRTCEWSSYFIISPLLVMYFSVWLTTLLLPLTKLKIMAPHDYLHIHLYNL